MAIGAIVGGTGLSAYSTLEEGKQAAEMGKITQQQAEAEATAVEQAGQYEAREKRKEAQRFKASQIAQVGVQGGILTGSKLLLVAESVGEYEMDALVIERNYGLEAGRLRSAGALAAYQGRLARRAARVRAFTNIAQTAGMMYLLTRSPSPGKYKYSGGKASKLSGVSSGTARYGGGGGGTASGRVAGGTRSLSLPSKK